MLTSKKATCILVCGLLFSVSAFSMDNVTLTPLLNYEYLSFQKQTIHAPGAGILFTKGNLNPPLSEERNSLSIAGISKQYIVQEVQPGYANLYHSINMMADWKINRHNMLGLFVVESDKPLYGGLRSFIAGLGYGYELLRAEKMSLILGLGLGAGDFGIDLPNGEPLPVMPIPIIRFNMETSWLDLSFEFLKKPVLNITLFPENRIRLTNTFGIAQFRDIRDLLFDTTLMYRLFPKESKMGDIAGIGVGIKNGYFGFPLAEKGKAYEVMYHSVYGLIDLSFLQIRSGYSFNSTEIYDFEKFKDIGNGFFVNVFLAWQF